jgi:hypothetical protein
MGYDGRVFMKPFREHKHVERPTIPLGLCPSGILEFIHEGRGS